MTNAMEVLFSYAQEWLEPPLLLSEPDCAEAQRCANEQGKRLHAMLNEETRQFLENYLDEQELLLFV